MKKYSCKHEKYIRQKNADEINRGSPLPDFFRLYKISGDELPLRVWKPRERQPTPLYQPRLGVILGVMRPLFWLCECLLRANPIGIGMFTTVVVVRPPCAVAVTVRRAAAPNIVILSISDFDSLRCVLKKITSLTI